MALGRRAAAYQAEWLADRPGDLEEILERVLRIDPRCDWALRQLIVSMTLAPALGRAAGGLRPRARLGPRSRAAGRAAQRGGPGRQGLRRPPGAGDHLPARAVHARAGRSPGQHRAGTLARAPRALERAGGLLARAPAGGAAGRRARALRERIALAELDRLNDPAAALQSLRALLGEKGDHERVLAALEQILALETAAGRGAPGRRRRAGRRPTTPPASRHARWPPSSAG